MNKGFLIIGGIGALGVIGYVAYQNKDKLIETITAPISDIISDPSLTQINTNIQPHYTYDTLPADWKATDRIHEPTFDGNKVGLALRVTSGKQEGTEEVTIVGLTTITIPVTTYEVDTTLNLGDSYDNAKWSYRGWDYKWHRHTYKWGSDSAPKVNVKLTPYASEGEGQMVEVEIREKSTRFTLDLIIDAIIYGVKLPYIMPNIQAGQKQFVRIDI